jgi:hypothetical protein
VLVGSVLVTAGVVLLVVTLWFWRAARPDNPVLAPLEVMGDVAFKNADAATRKEMLRRVRAEPLPHSGEDDELP